MKSMPAHHPFQTFMRSFKYAVKGIIIFIRTERNAPVHLFITVGVIVTGFIFKITKTEWIALLICIGMVLGAEIFNTSIEKLTNMVQPAYDEKAGIIKDLSAAAVLITTIIAVISGLIIFIPYLL